MNYARKMTIVAVLALLSTAASCPTHKTPEGLLAGYGVKIAQTVKAAQDAVGGVGTAPGVSVEVRKGSLEALKGLNVVNEKGVQLAGVLKAIHEARKLGQESPQSVTQALELIANIDEEVLLRVIPQLGSSPEAQASLKAVQEISKLILNIQFELGRS